MYSHKERSVVLLVNMVLQADFVSSERQAVGMIFVSEKEQP